MHISKKVKKKFGLDRLLCIIFVNNFSFYCYLFPKLRQNVFNNEILRVCVNYFWKYFCMSFSQFSNSVGLRRCEKPSRILPILSEYSSDAC